MICIGILNFEKFKSFCDLPILDLIMFVRFAVSQARYTQNRLVISYWAGRNDGRLLLFSFVNKHSRFQESLVTCPGGDFCRSILYLPTLLVEMKMHRFRKDSIVDPSPKVVFILGLPKTASSYVHMVSLPPWECHTPEMDDLRQIFQTCARQCSRWQLLRHHQEMTRWLGPGSVDVNRSESGGFQTRRALALAMSQCFI